MGGIHHQPFCALLGTKSALFYKKISIEKRPNFSSLKYSRYPLAFIADFSDDTRMSQQSYPGGKGTAYQQIINLMPPHKIYIETHLGGGAIMRNKKPAEINIGIDLDERVIASWRNNCSININLLQTDACDFLSTYDFDGSELIYCDPPYLTETRRKHKIYRHEYTREDHLKLLNLLIHVPCRVIISGYDNPLYHDKLTDWHSRSFSVVTRQGKALETVWFNYPPPVRLHDERYIGTNFREREKIKRRLNNLKKKIANMNESERHALLFWAQERYGQQAPYQARQINRHAPVCQREIDYE